MKEHSEGQEISPGELGELILLDHTDRPHPTPTPPAAIGSWPGGGRGARSRRPSRSGWTGGRPGGEGEEHDDAVVKSGWSAGLDVAGPPLEKPGTRPVSRAARMLALAHYVERLVEDGTVKSYADAARHH